MSAVVQPNPVLEAQVAALLQRLDRHREQRCREILEESESRARDLEKAAWREAADRGRAAVAEVRGHLASGRAQTQATLDGELRQLAQSRARAHLEALWQRLPTTLEELWRGVEHRERWVETALELAGSTLVGTEWQIEYEPGLDSRTLAEAVNRLDASHAVEPSFEPGSDIRAGIRIRSEGACLDATMAGLLTDVHEIEAAFLSMCDPETIADAARAYTESIDD